MKNIPVLSFVYLILLFLTPSTTFADSFFQTMEIPSSFNPVGSGARALGMGGAFIGVADDATAASWNPGGLLQLRKPEISFVTEGFHRIEDNSFGTNPEADGNETVSDVRLNYLSASAPIPRWGRNMALSLNYQHLYDFTRKWNYPLNERKSDTYWSAQEVDYQSEGSLSAFGLAYCFELPYSVSLGFTLNIWEDGFTNNEWENKRYQWGHGVEDGDTFVQKIESIEKYDFSGVNMNIGILWEINENFRLGAVLKTPFEADVHHKSYFQSEIRYPDLDWVDPQKPVVVEEDMTLDMPMSYGIGLAYRLPPELTLSLDIYRTEWDDFEFEDANGNKMSPITGKAASDVDPTLQVRLGAEYKFIKPAYVAAVRGGLFYDPAPAQSSPDDFYGFTVGGGFYYKWIGIDAAYQYRFGNDVGGSVLDEFDFSQDVEEHTFYASVIIYLGE